MNKKIKMIERKLKKNALLFCNFVLQTFTKFHVCSFILAQDLTEIVILNKLHFCEKWQFLLKYAQFDQYLKKD